MLYSPAGFDPAALVRCPKTLRPASPSPALPGPLGQLVSLSPGQRLVQRGARQQGVHVVESGVMALCRRHLDGRRHILFLARPQDILFAPQAGDSDAEPDAEALTTCRLRFHAEADLAAVPELGEGLAALLKRQHARALDHVFALGQREARARLCWYLSMLARGRSVIELELSRQDIADYLGLTIETLSREFTRLKRLGVIAYARHGVIAIRKPDLLEQNA